MVETERKGRERASFHDRTRRPTYDFDCHVFTGVADNGIHPVPILDGASLTAVQVNESLPSKAQPQYASTAGPLMVLSTGVYIMRQELSDQGAPHSLVECKTKLLYRAISCCDMRDRREAYRSLEDLDGLSIRQLVQDSALIFQGVLVPHRYACSISTCITRQLCVPRSRTVHPELY